MNTDGDLMTSHTYCWFEHYLNMEIRETARASYFRRRAFIRRQIPAFISTPRCLAETRTRTRYDVCKMRRTSTECCPILVGGCWTAQPAKNQLSICSLLDHNPLVRIIPDETCCRLEERAKSTNILKHYRNSKIRKIRSRFRNNKYLSKYENSENSGEAKSVNLLLA